MIRILALFLILLYSCNQQTKLPENILTQNKMQAVMTDMMRADEYISQFNNIDTLRTATQRRTDLYQKVFKIHKIDKKQFQNSLNFYQNHPDLFKPIIDSMHRTISQLGNQVPDSGTLKSLKK